MIYFKLRKARSAVLKRSNRKEFSGKKIINARPIPACHREKGGQGDSMARMVVGSSTDSRHARAASRRCGAEDLVPL